MARYRGSSSGSRCFNSGYYGSYDYAQYACVVVFAAVYLGIAVGFCITRRKFGRGKHLVGVPYMLALFFTFIEQIINFIWTTLSACQATNGSLQSAYDLRSALAVFDSLSVIFLLFVAIWTLNIMLRKQLGNTSAILKIVLAIDLAILGVLLLVITVLICYSYHFIGRSIYESPANLSIILSATQYISLALSAVIVISILGSGAVSLAAARSLKKKHLANTSIIIWIAVMTLAIFAVYLISIIQTAQTLTEFSYYDFASRMAAYWLSSFFYALAFVAIIFIAKNSVWNSATTHIVEPHSYGAGEQPLAYDYQQPPAAYGRAHV